MAHANTHPLPTPPVSPPQTALHASASAFVPNKGKEKATSADETRLQLVLPKPTEWSCVLDRMDKRTPVAKHLRSCHHGRKGWEERKIEKGEEKVYRLGYSESQNCKRCDRYWTIPSSIIPNYTARHFSSLESKEERQLDVFRQILADIDPVVKKFQHYQQAIAEQKKEGQSLRSRSADLRFHTECHFSQTQAYHGAGSMSDEVEYWQIQVLDKKQLQELQVRILEHPMIEKHRAVGGVVECLARLRYRRSFHQRRGAFYEEQGIEFNELVREYLLSNFRGLLPLDRPILGWDATGNVVRFGCKPGGNASVLSNKPDARRAADSYEHQATPLRRA